MYDSRSLDRMCRSFSFLHVQFQFAGLSPACMVPVYWAICAGTVHAQFQFAGLRVRELCMCSSSLLGCLCGMPKLWSRVRMKVCTGQFAGLCVLGIVVCLLQFAGACALRSSIFNPHGSKYKQRAFLIRCLGSLHKLIYSFETVNMMKIISYI